MSQPLHVEESDLCPLNYTEPHREGIKFMTQWKEYLREQLIYLTYIDKIRLVVVVLM